MPILSSMACCLASMFASRAAVAAAIRSRSLASCFTAATTHSVSYPCIHPSAIPCGRPGTKDITDRMCELVNVDEKTTGARQLSRYSTYQTAAVAIRARAHSPPLNQPAATFTEGKPNHQLELFGPHEQPWHSVLLPCAPPTR